MCNPSRRQVLQFLSIVLPADLLTAKFRDNFDKELVCSHVYDLRQPLPGPMLEKRGDTGPRSGGRKYFQIGLPELIICTTKIKFLDMFPYFWPITRQEVQRLHGAIEVVFQRKALSGKDDLTAVKRMLDRQQRQTRAVIFTLNRYTRPWCAGLIKACRQGGADEMLIFKDPSQPPYLCRHPSLQKGFKRPPPYSG
jgi:hypothetical protein